MSLFEEFNMNYTEVLKAAHKRRTDDINSGEIKMQAQQKQTLSWSDWHEQLFAKLSPKQKEVLNRNTKTVYSFYKSGKLPEDVVDYVCGGVL